MPKVVDRSEFLTAAAAEGFGSGSTLTRQQVKDVAAKHGVTLPRWLLNDEQYRASRGVYMLPSADQASAPALAPLPAPPSTIGLKGGMNYPEPAPVVEMAQSDATVSVMSSIAGQTVPAKIPNYVPFGHFDDVRTVLASNRFYPMFVTGLSGNGKTTMIEQACAALGRECFRVNITNMTDEDELLGSFVLEDGKTIWKDGPVTLAARRGAVLLLDEYDQATPKTMCLQPVLEGKPFLIKRINEIITPAAGFTVVATANTKGQGDETGRFIGANVMNEASLDRFPVCLEQEYPSRITERKIVRGMMKNLGCDDENFADCLSKWAETTRELYFESGEGEIITTRRLEHVVGAFAIFGDRMKSVEMATARFDQETKEAFRDLYTKIDAQTVPAQSEPTEPERVASGKVSARVPYDQKDQAKSFGARWEPDTKTWGSDLDNASDEAKEFFSRHEWVATEESPF